MSDANPLLSPLANPLLNPSVNPLVIRRLQLRRTPGIADPFTIDGLSAGINIVHGPNASGKTSTARAIEAVIWPTLDAGQRLSVTAQYDLGSSTYVVDIDSGHVGVQQNGIAGRAPELPAPEFRQRYRLSLHDLLLATDKGDRFAEEIARQSAGGYDLAGAAKKLGYQTRASTATTEYRAAEEARARLKGARESETALHGEARSLADLEARCAAAMPAGAREQLLRKALHHARATASVNALRERLSALPAIHAHIRGDEYEKLCALELRLCAETDDETVEASRLREAEQNASAAFPNGMPHVDAISSLRADVTTILEKERTLGDALGRASAAVAQLEEDRRAIGAAVTDDQLKAIDGVTFGELAEFAHAAAQSDAKLAGADTEAELAGDGRAPGDMDQVRDGIRLLAQWLGEGAAQASGKSWSQNGALLGWTALALSVLGWLLLSVVWHIGAVLGLVCALALAFLNRRRDDHAPDARGDRQRDYAKLGLPAPDSWVAEHVIHSLDSLNRRLADGRVSERRAEWRMEALHRHQDILSRRQPLEAQRTNLLARFGVAPDIDARQLSWLADRISRWQDASRERVAADGYVAACRVQYDELRARIGERLAPFGYPTPANASDAAGYSAALDVRAHEHAAATDRKSQARLRLGGIRDNQRQLKDEISTLLNESGATDLDAAALERICDEHTQYLEEREQLRLVEHELALARAALEADAEFEAGLIEEPEDVLEVERAKAAVMAEGYIALSTEATRLRTRVEEAKQKHSVEQALADVAAAEAVLRAARENDLRAIVGDTLVRHVQRVSRDEHRPEVFHRARKIFADITRGRYRLEFSDREIGAAATFRAVDTRTGVGHALDELSSATRVQLLLAVRVAFVETQEHGVRLPLFLDETLGTSDDYRAQAIIDAVIALAESGRQIFYFTAQRDEVAKWTSALAARGADITAIDLAAVRGMGAESAEELPAFVLPAGFLSAIPSRDGHTHDSYGDALSVPAIASGASGVGTTSATHLWYLIDDLDALERMLSLGITTWGELENLVEHGGIKILADYPHIYARAAAIARVVAVMQQTATIGSGRTIDRAVLLESNAVSERKMDDVIDLLARYHGSANDFLEALERKEVPGFQTKKVADLRAYLEREGYVDARPRRTAAEVRTGMLGAAMADIAVRTLADDDVDVLLHRVSRRFTRGMAATDGVFPVAVLPALAATAQTSNLVA